MSAFHRIAEASPLLEAVALGADKAPRRSLPAELEASPAQDVQEAGHSFRVHASLHGFRSGHNDPEMLLLLGPLAPQVTGSSDKWYRVDWDETVHMHKFVKKKMRKVELSHQKSTERSLRVNRPSAPASSLLFGRC